MFSLFRKPSVRLRNTSQSPAPPSAAGVEPGTELKERLEWFRLRLADCYDVIIHSMADSGRKYGLIYVSGMVNVEMIQEGLINLILDRDENGCESKGSAVDFNTLLFSACTVVDNHNEALRFILEGEVLLIIDGDLRMITYPFNNYEKRSIGEAQNEVVIRGSREAFIEDLHTNVTMLRRRIRSPELKLLHMQIGKHTMTEVVIAYMNGICRPELLKEIRHRLSGIHIDGVLESSYLEEFIEDHPYSPFPQIQNSERPDTAAAALLEGRVVIFTDGTPIVLIAPVTFPVFFQSPEDYYQRSYASTWIRWIRYTFMMVSLLAPSFYIALTTYHPEMIPASLLFSIAAAREPVPFPALFEALIMEITFEGLREASIRIPSAVGQAVSILGTLVIGEAAVRAGIVSSPMVIIVSLTGIASFIVPSYSLGLTLRLIRFPIMFLAGSFGLLGLSLGIYLLLLHLVVLTSLRVPYMTPVAPLKWKDIKDTLIRAPWRLMKVRPSAFGNQPTMRMNTSQHNDGDDRD
ncbi:spore germination protein [Paenibacillus sp. S150]|uniref:spore germination protein n=1 Tax=Paenibacillus sp. S150 TaxID=2749826 RepID=UPI001C57572A|nr:spore germination protein [Paenibacillus sp. S150]MBW4083614.1 spore germination protein [Paenibacillus sp. S150]